MNWVDTKRAYAFGLDLRYHAWTDLLVDEQSQPDRLPAGIEVIALWLDCSAIQTKQDAIRLRKKLYALVKRIERKLAKLKSEKQKSAKRPNPYSRRKETLKAQLDYFRASIQLLGHTIKIAPSGQP